MMTDWYEKMVKALQLNGKGERTHSRYRRGHPVPCLTADRERPKVASSPSLIESISL